MNVNEVRMEKVRELMDKQRNVRNISVIGNYAHGKSTLIDWFAAKAGIVSDALAGQIRYTDTRSDEQQRCISIKSMWVILS